MKFTCAACGEEHELGDFAWHFAEPLPWLLATDAEREQSTLTPEQCELLADEGVHYFIHALLQIPVRGRAEPFVFGVWCSLSEESHMEITGLWESAARVDIGPHFGWLCSKVPGYPDSMYLKTHVHQRPVGLRPLVELEATDHPLAVDQREGITPEKLADIVAGLIHQEERRK